MKSLLPPEAYWSNAVFDLEQQSWDREWQFIGFRHALRKHHDFISLHIGQHPVVVQNFQGELLAFDNVCSHRFARIQTEPCGNRPLQCHYHGWAYDAQGDPVGIPRRPRFEGLSELPRETLRLHRWNLATLGEMVFVARDPVIPELHDYLGDAWNELRIIGESLGELIDVNRMLVRANWKIAVENTLEAYHIGFVHENNFKKVIADEVVFTMHPPHSWWRSPLQSQVALSLAPVSRKLAGRSYQPPGWVHALLFPNLTIATTLGMTFAVQHFRPLSSGETEFVSYPFTTTTSGGNESPSPLMQAIHDATIKFNRDVFNEDRLIVEQVQVGVLHASKSGLLSDDEVRIHEFQKACRQRFDYTAACPEVPAGS